MQSSYLSPWDNADQGKGRTALRPWWLGGNIVCIKQEFQLEWRLLGSFHGGCLPQQASKLQTPVSDVVTDTAPHLAWENSPSPNRLKSSSALKGSK